MGPIPHVFCVHAAQTARTSMSDTKLYFFTKSRAVAQVPVVVQDMLFQPRVFGPTFPGTMAFLVSHCLASGTQVKKLFASMDFSGDGAINLEERSLAWGCLVLAVRGAQSATRNGKPRMLQVDPRYMTETWEGLEPKPRGRPQYKEPLWGLQGTISFS